MKSEVTEVLEQLLKGFEQIKEIKSLSKHVITPESTISEIKYIIDAIETFQRNNKPTDNDWEGLTKLLSEIIIKHNGSIPVADEFNVPHELSKSLKGKSGEHFVAGELFRRNTIVALPPQNTPMFDLIVTSPDGSKTCMVQVKTSFYKNRYGLVWELNKKFTQHIHREDLFVVLVDARSHPYYYIFAFNDLVDLVNSILALSNKKSKVASGKGGGKRIFISYADTFEPTIAEVFYSKKSFDWDVILNHLK